MLSLTINGCQIEASEGKTILEVARAEGIKIPTLCYLESLGYYGACRLCMVEISSPRGDILVASCTYPVSDGMTIKTDSDRVLRARRLILELLLADCPDADIVRQLALEYGIKEPRFPYEEGKCILCGICSRACANLIGVGAISLNKRGNKREVSPPFERASSVCISCGTCSTLCPTRAIDIKKFDRLTGVHAFNDKYVNHRCIICGEYHLEIEHEVKDKP